MGAITSNLFLMIEISLNVHTSTKMIQFSEVIMLKAFFSRPGSICEIKEFLIKDIQSSKTQILLAVAYFNDMDFYNAINNSKAGDKRFVFNNADLNRESDKRPAEIYKELSNRYNSVVLGTHYLNEIPNYMHHKFYYY